MYFNFVLFFLTRKYEKLKRQHWPMETEMYELASVLLPLPIFSVVLYLLFFWPLRSLQIKL